MQDLRIFLYPLGFLASFAFGTRFLIQWIVSEKAKRSEVPSLFWQVSLFGNLLLVTHSFIQFQAHVCMVQACNAVISWRNLNLMQKRKPPVSLTTIFGLLISVVILVSFGFSIQHSILEMDGNWFRIPQAPWQEKAVDSTSFVWHAMGAIGYLLFSSRFWIQWWLSEKHYTSVLPESFWWISLVGACISILYFSHIGDIVTLIGPLIGFIPYIRNLILIRRKELSG